MSQKSPRVIIVSGPPGAGKTTFTLTLAERLALPIIAKDDIKESLFDNLGFEDRAYSMKLGQAAIELQFQFAQELMRAQRDFILETAFHRQSASTLKQILAGAVITQVWLTADTDTLIERAKHRARHPGHGELTSALEEEIRAKVEDGVYSPLPLDGDLIKLNTEQLDGPDYQATLDLLQVRFG